MKLLFKANVQDPSTFETHYAGVSEVEDGKAQSLISRHPEYVEELTEENLSSMRKDEVLVAAQAAGAEVDGSEKKEELVKKAVKS